MRVWLIVKAGPPHLFMKIDLPFSSGKPGVSMQLVVQRTLPREICKLTTTLFCDNITAVFSMSSCHSDANADLAVIFIGKKGGFVSFEVLGLTAPSMAVKMLIQVIQCLDGDVFMKMWSKPVLCPCGPGFTKKNKSQCCPR